LAIVHADSPDECFNRMVTMMLMSGIRLSGQQIQKQLATSIDLIVYVELYMDGIRRIANITDLICGKEDGSATLTDIFTFKQERIDDKGQVIGDWVINNKRPSFYDKFVKRNIQLPEGFFV
jgi:pilus assembly protein CpaF